MSDYTVTYDGAALDAANTIISGATIETELNAIATAIATKGGLEESNTWTGSNTFAGTTIADLGTVTTADINGGTIDGATVGANSASTGAFTTLSAAGAVTITKSGGSTLTLGDGTADTFYQIIGNADRSSGGTTLLQMMGYWNDTSVCDIVLSAGSDTSNKDDGAMSFRTSPASGTLTTALSISNAQIVTIGSVDINGGEVDGTTVGANSASTGAFTDLTASGAFSLSGDTIQKSEGGTGAAALQLFSARMNAGTTSVPNTTWTKVECDLEDYDPDSVYDATTNYRFSPTVEGYYHLHGTVYFTTDNLVDQKIVHAAIYDGGTAVKLGTTVVNGTTEIQCVQVDCIRYADGSSDYFELFVYQDSGATLTLQTGGTATTFSAHWCG